MLFISSRPQCIKAKSYFFRNKNRFITLSIWISFETRLKQSAPSMSISIMCSRRKQSNGCVHGCWPTRNTNTAALSTAWRSTDLQSSTSGMPWSPIFSTTTGIILDMGSATERRPFSVTPSFIGGAHTQIDPCARIEDRWRQAYER